MGVAVSNLCPCAVPTTYQEWLDCFAYVKVHPNDNIGFSLLRKGTLRCDSYILDAFLQRMDETVGDVLNKRISNFLSQVSELFEEGDFEGVEMLATRFWASTSECFFFENLDCISSRQKMQFRDGYLRQLKCFWANFIRELEKDADEYRNIILEDLFFQLSRLSSVKSHERNVVVNE